MPSPTQYSDETHSQDCPHASSQHAVGAVFEDTTSSAYDKGHVPGSSATHSFVAPNSAFVQQCALSRGRSTSPGPQRALSPLGVSVAQRRAQLAERITESAMSRVGRVTEETRCARGIVEAAIAEAKSVHGEVESRVASLAAQAEASTVQVVGALCKHVKEMVPHSEAETSCVIGFVAQQLEKEVEVAMVSAATMSERNT